MPAEFEFGPRNSFGEIPVVPAGSGVRTARGGIAVQAGDFNPERVLVDDRLAATPSAEVGDTLSGATVGVLDYSFGTFKLLPSTSPTVLDGGLAAETTQSASAGQLAVRGAVAGGPAGQGGEHVPGGASAAGVRERGHAEHACPAGFGDSAADRDDIGPDQHRGVGAWSIHPAENVPLRAGAAAGTVHRQPCLEPCVRRLIVHADPQFTHW
jgi:hypothetical protein